MKLFKPASASHWYDRTGQAVHTVPMKSKPGETRHTTVADARKMKLLPSSTNIIGVMDKPQLRAWRETQAVLSALTLPRNPGEGDDDFAARVVVDSETQVREAAAIGTKIHDAIEQYLCLGRYAPDDAVKDLFAPFKEWADKNILDVKLAEQVVIGDGYAGRLDLKAELRDVGLAIIDFKTRKRYNGKFTTYNEDDLQLASYQQADRLQSGDETTRVSILIDSQEPSDPFVHPWPKEGDDEAYKTFMSAFQIWKYIKRYNPNENL